MNELPFVCPVCKSVLKEEDNDLFCFKCKCKFKKINSVYNFSNLKLTEETQKTVKQFANSWKIFSHYEDYHEKQFLDWIFPLTKEDFKRKVVLEAGCGKGRHTKIVSSYNLEALFSVDLSEAIFLVEKLLHRELKDGFPLTLVRCDLKKLPFSDNFFDLIFCIGVLHHIDSMEEALKELWRILKPGGRIVLWVYGKEGNFWIIYILNPLRKFITSRLPVNLLRILSFPLSLLLFFLLKAIYGPLTRWGKKESFLYYSSYLGAISQYPFKEIENIVVDHLCPPVAHYLSKEEIEKMVKNLNPSFFSLRWHRKNSWNILLKK